MRCASRLMDGAVWDGKDAKVYANGFKVRVGCKELGSVPM